MKTSVSLFVCPIYRRILVLVAVAGATWLSGCEFGDGYPDECQVDSDCGAGAVCNEDRDCVRGPDWDAGSSDSTHGADATIHDGGVHNASDGEDFDADPDTDFGDGWEELPDPDDARYRYRWVMIRDLSSVTKGFEGGEPHSGADIDAVVLHKADGTVWYATALLEYSRDDLYEHSLEDSPDAEQAIVNAPDVYPDYPDVTTCSSAGQSLPLGGGYAIVRMPAPIEPGDDLVVLEESNCSSSSEADTLQVWISPLRHSPDDAWIALTQGSLHPDIRFRIPELPNELP